MGALEFREGRYQRDLVVRESFLEEETRGIFFVGWVVFRWREKRDSLVQGRPSCELRERQGDSMFLGKC